MAIGILFATYERLWQPPDVPGGPIVAVAVLGVLVNLAGLWRLHAGAGETLTVRGACLEVMGDAISSGVVIVAGAIILSTGWAIADPIAGALIALFLLPRTWTLLRQAVNILLEGAPAHLDVTEIEEALCSAPSDKILEALHVILHARFGIDHTTIQIETEP